MVIILKVLKEIRSSQVVATEQDSLYKNPYISAL